MLLRVTATRGRTTGRPPEPFTAGIVWRNLTTDDLKRHFDLDAARIPTYMCSIPTLSPELAGRINPCVAMSGRSAARIPV
jgi:hypothetical protein